MTKLWQGCSKCTACGMAVGFESVACWAQGCDKVICIQWTGVLEWTLEWSAGLECLKLSIEIEVVQWLMELAAWCTVQQGFYFNTVSGSVMSLIVMRTVEKACI